MKSERKIKIIVTGTRGIPDILGGVETHCEELYPRLANNKYTITIVRRSCYITDNIRIDNYKGISLKDIYAPRKKSLEAIVHTFLAITCRHLTHSCDRAFIVNTFCPNIRFKSSHDSPWS